MPVLPVKIRQVGLKGGFVMWLQMHEGRLVVEQSTTVVTQRSRAEQIDSQLGSSLSNAYASLVTVILKDDSASGKSSLQFLVVSHLRATAWRPAQPELSDPPWFSGLAIETEEVDGLVFESVFVENTRLLIFEGGMI